jgi:hypothetical protein
MKELLEEWQSQYSHIFRVIFCVGSRWNNIHFAAKKKIEYVPPPLPEGFHTLQDAELVSLPSIVSLSTLRFCFLIVIGMDK